MDSLELDMRADLLRRECDALPLLQVLSLARQAPPLLLLLKLLYVLDVARGADGDVGGDVAERWRVELPAAVSTASTGCGGRGRGRCTW